MLKKPANVVLPDNISVSVSWVDGRIVFKTDTRFAQFYYGICNYSKKVFAISPLDHERALMITTIDVAPVSGVCSRAKSCFHFKCPFNKFKRKDYIEEFADVGAFSLSLPNDIEKKEELWFNSGQWGEFWNNFVLPYSGGVLKYKEDK